MVLKSLNYLNAWYEDSISGGGGSHDSFAFSVDEYEQDEGMDADELDEFFG
jgi:hypothetical protein